MKKNFDSHHRIIFPVTTLPVIADPDRNIGVQDLLLLFSQDEAEHR